MTFTGKIPTNYYCYFLNKYVIFSNRNDRDISLEKDQHFKLNKLSFLTFLFSMNGWQLDNAPMLVQGSKSSLHLPVSSCVFIQSILYLRGQQTMAHRSHPTCHPILWLKVWLEHGQAYPLTHCLWLLMVDLSINDRDQVA